MSMGIPDGFRLPTEAERSLLDRLFPEGSDDALREQALRSVVRVWRDHDSHWEAQLISHGAPASALRNSGPWLYHYTDEDGTLVSGEVTLRDDGYIDQICFGRVVDVSEDESYGDEGRLVIDPIRAVGRIELVGPFGDVSAAPEHPQPVHCCEQMTECVEYTCDMHPEFGSCHDYVIGYSPEFDEYGILVHDNQDGSSDAQVAIAFCPFCGAELPPSRREEWFDWLFERDLEPDEAPEETTRYGWWLAERG